MDISFNASAISVSPVDGVLTVALLERPSGEGAYLLLKRGGGSADPARTGDFVEVCSPKRSAYHGIESVHVAMGKLTFVFNAEGKRQVGADRACIGHVLKGSDFTRMLSALKRILGDACVRHAIPSREDVDKFLRIQGDAPDTFGEIDLFVPAFERSFPVHIDLRDGAGVTADTQALIHDIVTMDAAARATITSLLYVHAMKTAEEVAFGDRSGNGAPAGVLGRLFPRLAKNRFIPIGIDNPEHPCHFENGIASVERKVEWTGFRIDENATVKSRLCLLDCRPQWDEENGVSIIIRNGLPVATSDSDVNIADFDGAAF